MLARTDPELVEAANEVDVTLLRWSLGLSPLERLQMCTQMAGALDGLRRGLVSQ